MHMACGLEIDVVYVTAVCLLSELDVMMCVVGSGGL